MTAALTAWLLTTTALGAAATLAAWSRTNRFRAAAVAAFLAAGSVTYWTASLPLGHPINGAPPPGNYTVLGARIDVPTAADQGAIYVLLDSGDGVPAFYKLPYSEGDANDLQAGLDASVQGDGGVGMEYSEGEYVFHPPPVSSGEDKVPEQTIGGF